MKVEEAYAQAQHKIEALLTAFFPENFSPYFNRGELVGKLLHIAAVTANEVTSATLEHAGAFLSSPRTLYIPICPKCGYSVARREEEPKAQEQPEEGCECPNCHNGTIGLENDRLVCRGECGVVFPKSSGEEKMKAFAHGEGPDLFQAKQSVGIIPIVEKK
jgi:hypothetical protein